MDKLTDDEVLVLRHLQDNPVSSVGEACRKENITSGSASQIEEKLKQAGYISQARRTKDGTYYNLTERGQSIL